VRLRSALPAAAVALTLLAVWPAAGSPFHDPKRWVFLAAAGLGALASLPRWRWTALPLIALTVVQPWRSAEAGWQALAFAWALAAWPALQPELRHFSKVIGVAGTLVGLVVILQFFGVDLFALAGPEAGTGRLRLYGTLGNPDFVASALLPISLLLLGVWTHRSPQAAEARQGWPNSGSVRISASSVEEPARARAERDRAASAWRRIDWATRHRAERTVVALVLLLGALMMTRSFATLLSAVAALLVLLIHRRGARVVPLLVVCVVLGLGLIGRDLGGTLAGRSYLLAVALPHVADAPLLGHGLGSTVQEWPAWELSYWQARCADAACVAAHPQGRFAALQDHVHADWLEWLLEVGVLGVLALLLALGAPLLAAWRRTDVTSSWVLAALAAVLTRALVDFPLHRPADLCLLAALCAVDVSRSPTGASPLP
jgi:hypothetical protein